MTHGNPHEEAEHATHHAADPFDQIQASVERDLLVGLLNRDARLRDDPEHDRARGPERQPRGRQGSLPSLVRRDFLGLHFLVLYFKDQGRLVEF